MVASKEGVPKKTINDHWTLVVVLVSSERRRPVIAHVSILAHQTNWPLVIAPSSSSSRRFECSE